MKKFWDWIRDEDEGRILRLEGPIDSDNFWGDEITPQAFRSELEAEDGDLTIFINSPGGNVFAAAEIYTMIKEYPHNVTVKIASIAASAASVVAMAGDRVLMSPTAMLMIHDPMTIAMGNKKDFERAIDTLNEVKESIINAYRTKTGISRNKIAELMEDETWMNAKKAVDLGFADEVLYQNKQTPVAVKSDDSDNESEEKEKEEEEKDKEDSKEDDSGEKEKTKDHAASDVFYQTRIMNQTIMDSISDEIHEPRAEPEKEVPVIGMDGRTKDGAIPFEILINQLSFLR